MNPIKYSVISGEILAQKKLRPVSMQGENKKKGEMMEGKEGKTEVVDGG